MTGRPKRKARLVREGKSRSSQLGFSATALASIERYLVTMGVPRHSIRHHLSKLKREPGWEVYRTEIDGRRGEVAYIVTYNRGDKITTRIQEERS